jgi:hypothetical protein
MKLRKSESRQHDMAKACSGTLPIVLKPSVKTRERFISNVRVLLKLNRHLPVRDQRASRQDAQWASTSTSDCGCVGRPYTASVSEFVKLGYGR